MFFGQRELCDPGVTKSFIETLLEHRLRMESIGNSSSLTHAQPSPFSKGHYIPVSSQPLTSPTLRPSSGHPFSVISYLCFPVNRIIQVDRGEGWGLASSLRVLLPRRIQVAV